MKKLLIAAFLLLSSCVHRYETVTCTPDSSYYEDFTKVSKIEVQGVYPPIYKIYHPDGTYFIYYGSCHIRQQY